MATIGEIYVVTSSGTGHLVPCIQLCNHLSSTNYTPTLVAPSTVSADHLPAVIHITAHAEETPTSGTELEAHLFVRFNGPGSAHPACAIFDFQMGWTKHIFWKFKIPVISFFTFGACPAAMEWGAWMSGAGSGRVNPGEVHLIPGLPAEMQLTYHDFV
ncbi:uncharacterized protein [Henckelia pumila]|uniref:uncharacterized protein n=1 Tax=Henckelia pumila TaxID=405737 RepID=UPI003C6DD44E